MGNACRVSGGAFHPAICTKARDGAANGLDGYYGNRSMSSFPRDMAASFDLVGVRHIKEAYRTEHTSEYYYIVFRLFRTNSPFLLHDASRMHSGNLPEDGLPCPTPALALALAPVAACKQDSMFPIWIPLGVRHCHLFG
ncbi:hypothetical protein X797_003636 [Metarhizium robertsii]|uniref:Phosphotransferase n=2 Tax=Metarhizium robertsii TaxID=568076 RepID=A0A0B2X977_METRA|nr:phosphotransferase [Metarhizium robertsii ARSEF 23]EXV03837.1 hypothetical protein X797_003636 [Metarhizium robertsii]KHO11438.1 phosphotransferase [Metarhizium robertsii ARSEF 23]